jgi:hypothetical protein
LFSIISTRAFISFFIKGLSTRSFRKTGSPGYRFSSKILVIIFEPKRNVFEVEKKGLLAKRASMKKRKSFLLLKEDAEYLRKK